MSRTKIKPKNHHPHKHQSHSHHNPWYKNNKLFIIIGGVLLGVGLSLFLAIYSAVLFQEITYTLKPGSNQSTVLSGKEEAKNKITAAHQKVIIRPVDEEFGIVIPKIGANSKVVADVSPYNEKEYQTALTKGVAQARDSAYPGQYGNTFIFAHSASSWYEANRYNAIFYLLTKLKNDDNIYIFYKGEKYLYKVTQKKLVDSNALEYLQQNFMKKQLTLMTCWPPGTTLQRLIVQADLQTL